MLSVHLKELVSLQMKQLCHFPFVSLLRRGQLLKNLLPGLLFCEQILSCNTRMCLSIGMPKIINFPFVPNGKFIIFRCPNIWAHYSRIIMCLNIGTPNNHKFTFGTNGKVVVLGVPILSTLGQ